MTVPAKRKVKLSQAALDKIERDEWTAELETLTDAIERGVMDDIMLQVGRAINERLDKVRVGMGVSTVVETGVTSDFRVGEIVEIQNCNPNYINGLRYKILGKLHKNYRIAVMDEDRHKCGKWQGMRIPPEYLKRVGV